MRNFKKVIALVLAVALMMSTFTVAFAAENTSASKLVTLGLLSDGSEASLSAGLTREIGLTMILKTLGYTQADADKAAAAPFADTKGWVKAWANLAYEKGITKGTGATTFGGSAKLTGDQFVTFALRGLGVEVKDTTKAVELAITAGLLPAGSTVAAKFTKGDAANVMFAALNTTVPGTTPAVKLYEKLLAAKVITEANAVAAGLVPATFALSSVATPNGRQVVLTFSKNVDADSVKADNIKVYLGTATAVTTWTDKDVNGKVVTLGLNADIPQDSDVKVVVKDVQVAGGTEKVAEVTNTVRMKDVSAPTVLSVVASTSKTFTITSNEPLKIDSSETSFHVLKNITVDGVKLVAKITPNYSNNTAVVELGTKLAVGEHKVVIDGYKDIVGFAAAKFEGSISVVEDKAAPTLVSVETVSRTKIKLVFDEPINALGTVTVNNGAFTQTAVSADKKTFTGTIAAMGLASLVKATVKYVGTTDMEGNAVSTDGKTFDFVAADDTVAPTATITFKASTNEVKIAFSEEVSVTGKVTVKDSKGTKIVNEVVPTTVDADDTTGKTYLVTTGILTAGTYTVELKDSKDNGVRENTITTATVSLTSSDITKPSISAVVLKTAYAAATSTTAEVKGQATVFFSEAMDVATTSNTANYLVDLDGAGAGAAVQLSTISGSAAAASSDAKSVVLTIPGSTFLAGTTTVYVLAVKDAAGQLIQTADFNVARVVAATSNALTITAYEATATNKIKVTFSNTMLAVDPSEFKVSQAGTTTAAFVGIAYEIDATTPSIVTITLNGNLTTDGKYAATDAAVATLSVGNTNTKDVFGAVNTTLSALNLVDKIAPAIDKIETGSVVGAFSVTFTEVVTAAPSLTSALANDLIIKDADGNVVTATFSVSGKEVSVAITGSTGKTYTVELIARSITDAAGNKVTAKAATSVTAK